MSILMLMMSGGVVAGMILVASNPSPFFGALGLVLVAGVGCGVLAGHGGSFLSLVLFLIYLGGMLVVFAYCAALAAEPYPVNWSDWSVLGSMSVPLMLVLGVLYWFWGELYVGVWESVDELIEFSTISGDSGGVASLYSSGGWLLVLGAGVLLLALIAVLELTRGLARGALRAV
nr:NADH dehydrogenase subunit 6 [Melanonus zugmayeri]